MASIVPARAWPTWTDWPPGRASPRSLPGRLRRVPCGVAPWTPLPPDADTYAAGLSSTFRRQLRRASARLAEAGVAYRTRRGAAALGAIDTLRELHRAQWGSRSNFLPVFGCFAAACRLAVDADEVAVHETRRRATRWSRRW